MEMTYREAAKMIRDIFYRHHDALTDEHRDALSLAVYVLEAQEPLPDSTAHIVSNEYDFFCGVCKGELGCLGGWGNFCPHCGRRLNWGDIR